MFRGILEFPRESCLATRHSFKNLPIVHLFIYLFPSLQSKKKEKRKTELIPVSKNIYKQNRKEGRNICSFDKFRVTIKDWNHVSESGKRLRMKHR